MSSQKVLLDSDVLVIQDRSRKHQVMEGSARELLLKATYSSRLQLMNTAGLCSDHSKI